MTKRVLVVGIGSNHGDDQVGWLVVKRLKSCLKNDSITYRLASSPIDLLDWLGGCQTLVICDACRGLGPSGKWKRICWPSPQVIQLKTSGTHNFNLATVLMLAQKLKKLPQRVELWILEGKTGQPGNSVSPEVTASLEEMAQQLKLVLENSSKGT